jgi:hypothetical protein
MKNFFFWILAFTITISAAFFQRVTGPTYPKKVTAVINNVSYDLNLKRSQTNTRECNIKFEVPASVTGTIFYRRYPSGDDWSKAGMMHLNGFLSGVLPSQPAAGKLEYYIILHTPDGSDLPLLKEKPVIIRFKGNVPALVMIPHILIMFIAMLLSSLAGIYAISRNPKYKKYGILTFAFLIAGGLVLGPLVQMYAFGDLWTGIPFGWDLTDNKTLIAAVVWLTAVLVNRKKERPYWTLAASIVLLLVYSVPHSLFGSQLNYASGEVSQGIISLFTLFN